MTGLTLVVFKPEDLQCSFFRYTVRELLACAVFRPLLNLANPRVINEKIEYLVLSFSNKADKGVVADETTIIKPDGSSNPSAEQFPGFLDHSSVGVELVQVRHDRTKISTEQHIVGNANGMHSQKDQNDSGKIEAHSSGAEWAQMLDIITRRKTQVLAPEHLENVWTKGRNYRKKEGAKQFAKQVAANAGTSLQSAVPSHYLIENKPVNSTSNSVPASSYSEDQGSTESFSFHTNYNGATHHSIPSHQEKPELLNHEEVQSDSGSSYQTEDDENGNVTGLDSPGTRVWDSRNKINASVSHIRHPLETSEIYLTKKSGKDHIRHPRTMRTSSGRKRLRSSKQKAPTWQEVERTSFLLGEGHDILNESKVDSKAENMSDDPDVEIWGRVHSGAAASSSLSSISMSKSCTSSMRSESSVLADSFIKLRCEVLGANIVKSGSGMFAVYSIAVTDANNNSWSIKRRFRHFEELHRRLKEFPEYNLSLPPKHFLSSGLDVPVVQERCKLLDKYLKMLLQFPTISGSIEVWDFLSVDSQTYMFSDSLSILQTLSVNPDDKSYEKNPKIHSSVEDKNSQLLFKGECLSPSNKEYPAQRNTSYFEADNLGLRKRNMDQSLGTNSREKINNSYEDNSGSDSENRLQKNTPLSSKSDKPNEVSVSGADNLEVTSQILGTVNGSTIPMEWVPPNLTAPVLNLIDVIFQLQDGGWIRRQAFWVAKQLLQLGMGDAFDDWLIEKIQLLRRGSVVASAINRVENILWPDGIFITKHPKRKPPTPMSTEQQQEAIRRAKFVYEIMIDKAPATLVSLVGRKDYELSVQDIYFFLQSPVCLKQLAFEILELLLLSAFPELDDVVRQCHEAKEQFGVLEDSK